MKEIGNVIGICAMGVFCAVMLSPILPEGGGVWAAVGLTMLFGLWYEADKQRKAKIAKEEEERLAMSMHETEVRLRLEAEQK